MSVSYLSLPNSSTHLITSQTKNDQDDLLPSVMLPEKAQHLSRSIGSFRISIRGSGTPSRPGMARLVDNQLLRDNSPMRLVINEARVSVASNHLSLFHRRISRQAYAQ